MDRVIPLSRRKGDIVVLGFFWLNILLITYIVDVEQIVLPDISGDWEYPLWPPAFWVDIIHWYGNNFDPVLIARPAWWRMTIWIDSLFFGPFYMFAIYAWTKGKNWIRIPSIIWASVMMTNVTIILGEEFMGAARDAGSPPGSRPERALASGPGLRHQAHVQRRDTLYRDRLDDGIR